MSKASHTGKELTSAVQDPKFKESSSSVQRIGTSARDLMLDRPFREFVNDTLGTWLDNFQAWPRFMRFSFADNERWMIQWNRLVDSAFDDFPLSVDRFSDFPRLFTAMTSFRDSFGPDWRNFWLAGQDWRNAMQSMDQALRRDFQSMLKDFPNHDVAKQIMKRFDQSSAYDAWSKFAQESRTMLDTLSKNMESGGWDQLIGEFIVKDQFGKVTGVNLDAFSDVSMMIPVLFQSIQNVEVPRIEIQEKDSRMVADNIRLQPTTFQPNQVSLNTESSIVNGEYEFHVDATATTLVNLDNIVYMYFNKTFVQGDVGKMDLKFDLQLHTRFRVHAFDAISKSSPALVKENLDTEVSNLSVNITKTEHEALHTVMKPIIQSQIKIQMDKYMDGALDDWFGQFNKAMTDVIRGTIPSATAEE
jgi:hypothetical protein